ncbi:MAG: hypothetical protein ACO3BO_06485, partial [Anaerohalosphaeraceae bacterium]
LHENAQYVQYKHQTPPHLLKGIRRHQEHGGPPRIGDVSMDCAKLKAALDGVGIVIEGFN